MRYAKPMSLWLVTMAFVFELRAAEQPTIAAAKIDTPPKIDGALDDACWQTPPAIAAFVGLRDATPPPTQVWVARDDHALYLAFRCADPEAKAIRSRVTQRDAAVQADESVEIFIDPGTNLRTYYHFMLSAANVQADQEVRRGRRHRDWNADWASATKIGAQAWTAELAIPFHALLERGATGRPWRFNVTRNKHAGGNSWSTWARLERQFHEPKRFGVLTGMERVQPVFAPRLTSAEVSGYQTDAAGEFYTLTAKVRNESGRAGHATIVVADRPTSGQPARTEAEVALASVETRDVAVRVPVARPCDRRVEVRLEVDGKPRHGMSVGNTDPLRPLDAYVCRNYYTTEPAAQIACTVALPESERQRAELAVAPVHGPAAWKRTQPVAGEETLVELPLAGVEPGAYQAAVELRSRRAVLSRRMVAVIKRKPAPAREVKLDRLNRAVLVDGKPFFPFALYSSGEMDLEDVAACGFNSIIGWRYRSKLSTKLLDDAAAAGLMVIEPPHRFFPKPLRYSDPKFVERATEYIDTTVGEVADMFAEHPALLAYYSFDEPDCAQAWVKGKSMADLVADAYAKLHERDPYHPVFGLFSMGLPTEAKWWRGYDFGGVDYYPSMGGDRGLRSTTLLVAQGAIDTVASADVYRTPAWLVINSETFSASVRPIAPDEQRCQTYLALIYRAKGLLYFVGPLRHVRTQAIFKQLAAEVKQIAPALLEREPKQQVGISPESARDPYGFPPVHARFKRSPDGQVLLLVANSQPAAATATFELPQATAVRSLFDSKPRSLERHAFTEAIGRYGTRVFVVEGLPAHGPLRLTVRVSGPAVAQLAALERGDTSTLAADSIAGAAKAKMQQTANLLANGALESAEGWKFLNWGSKEQRQTCSIAFVPSGRPQGGMCACISRGRAKSASQIVSDWITLEPYTEYRYGAWARAEITQGRMAATIVLRDDNKKAVAWSKKLSNGQLYSRIGRVPAGQREWKLFADTVTTGAQPRRVQMWCQVANAAGRVWFDDAFVHKVRTVGPPKATSRNLVLNSSFEFATLPGWPDHWNGSLNAGPSMGAPGARWQQVSDQAFHGSHSVRVIRPAGLKKWEYGRTYYMPTPHGIQVAYDQTYTLSVYLKADRPGVNARISVSYVNRKGAYDGARKRVTLTPEWTRYELTFTPANISWSQKLAPIFAVYGEGAVWIDAVQLEAGDKATEYVEDDSGK